MRAEITLKVIHVSLTSAFCYRVGTNFACFLLANISVCIAIFRRKWI